jgi:hypothetical protein
VTQLYYNYQTASLFDSGELRLLCEHGAFSKCTAAAEDSGELRSLCEHGAFSERAVASCYSSLSSFHCATQLD